MLRLNKVHHVAVICSDYQRSLDFYTRILGMRVLAEHYRENRNSYKTDLALGDEYVIELFSFPSPPPRVTNPEAAGLRHLAFEVDSIAETVAELNAMGIAHEEVRKDEYTGKHFCFFKDPDGLPIEVYENHSSLGSNRNRSFEVRGWWVERLTPTNLFTGTWEILYTDVVKTFCFFRWDKISPSFWNY